MSEHENDLTEEELTEQNGEELPAREAMSLVDVGGGGSGGIIPLPDPFGPGDFGGPGSGEHTLPVEPPAES